MKAGAGSSRKIAKNIAAKSSPTRSTSSALLRTDPPCVAPGGSRPQAAFQDWPRPMRNINRHTNAMKSTANAMPANGSPASQPSSNEPTNTSVIVVGLRGRRGKPFVFPSPTHGAADSGASSDWRTVAEVLEGLPSAAAPGHEPELSNHVARAHTPAVRSSFEATPQGRRNDRFKRDRLRWDRPAKVVRAQGKLKNDGKGGRHSSHQAIHPDEPRQLTVRECARIQSFPDWYAFPSTHCNGYRVVGDAVPPLLSEAIGRALNDQLFSLEVDSQLRAA